MKGAAQTIRSLIIDDEPLAREGIRELLRTEGDIEIIGECANGVQAVEEILSKKPDLVFLDIQMPEMDGFDVVREVQHEHLPAIIFVTAYDEFAIKAFEVHALDYLLKPVDPDRFQIALKRTRELYNREQFSPLHDRLLGLLNDVGRGGKYRERIAVKSGGTISFVRVRDIEWVGADGDYVTIYARGKKHLIRGKISEFQEKLDPGQFVRIHRSTIVNLDQVKELQPLFYGEYSVSLHNGTKLRLSRSYREKLQAFLDH